MVIQSPFEFRRSTFAALLLAMSACTPARPASFATYRAVAVDGVPLGTYAADRTAMLCWGDVTVAPTPAGDHLRLAFHQGSGYGLAVAVSGDGYFLTAGHCAAGPRLVILYRTADGRPWSATPRVVYAPPAGGADVALLKVDRAVDRSLPWAAAEPAVGTAVVAIGAGFGESQPTPTEPMGGHVTGAEPWPPGPRVARVLFGNLPGRPGDSGGPVLTVDGRGVGVTAGGDEASGQSWIVCPDPAWLAATIAADRMGQPRRHGGTEKSTVRGRSASAAGTLVTAIPAR